MTWLQILIIVFANVVLAAILMRWSGKEGKEFRKKIRNAQ